MVLWGEDGMPRSSTRRWIHAGVAAVLFVAAATVVPAGADTPLGNYTGIASASGARMTLIVPGEYAVEEVIDAGGPLAQSRLGAGAADSFASFPYPGGTAVAYQGLLAIATGISSPFAYPFFVSATQPGQPKQEMVDPSGAYALKAAAAPSSATADARLRSGAPDSLAAGTSATSAVVAENDSVVATASSLAEGITLGNGVLSVGNVASRSVTKLTAGHDPVTATELMVSALRVGDKRIGVGPGGFELLGTPVPLPAADVAKLIATTLAPAGLQLRFIAPETITGGARAAAIEIVSHQAPPNIPASDMTIRLGGALSAITFGEGTVQLPDAGSLPAGGASGDNGNGGGGSAANPGGAATSGGAPTSGGTSSNTGGDGSVSTGTDLSGAAGGLGGRAFGTGALTSGAGSPGFAGNPGFGVGSTASAETTGTAGAAASDQAAAAGLNTGGTTLEATPIFAPRRASALGLLYAIAGALGLSAVVGAGAWAIRGRWSA